MAADSGTDIDTEIARLSGLGLDRLRSRWRSEFGRVAPTHLSKHFLLHLLAYRLQVQAFCDLSPSTRRMLDALAKEKKSAVAKNAAVPIPGQGQLLKGTVLVREHEGQQHHVMTTGEGFVWNGRTYPSLSKVAYAITGTKWNGPRFFGLRDPSGGKQS